MFGTEKLKTIIEAVGLEPTDKLIKQINKDKIIMMWLLNMCLMRESLDRFIEHRIKTDKVIVGILKDIQGDIASMADYEAITERMKKFIEDNMESLIENNPAHTG